MTWLVLISLISAAELQAVILANMTAAGLPTTTAPWDKDGFWQNLVSWVALQLRILYALINAQALNAFLETASGPGLTDLAAGTFGTARRLETFADGTITLQNDSGLLLDEAAEGISFALVADPTITFKNSAAVYALNGDSVVVPIVCDVAGTIGNALAGVFPSNTIELVTTLTGVSVVENSQIVGQDKQEDDDLKQLARKQAANASTNHRDKPDWLALNTNTDGTIAEPNDGKTRVNINRVSVSTEDDQGRVFVVLASPAGPVDVVEYATTIEVLQQYALTGPAILVDTNASAVPVNITATVELQKGTLTAGVGDTVTTFVAAWFPSTENTIGSDDGFLTLDELRLLIGRAHPKIRKVTFSAPGADVAIAANEVATAGTITISVTVQP